MKMFKITESSLSNFKIRMYARCEPACVGAYKLSVGLSETSNDTCTALCLHRALESVAG